MHKKITISIDQMLYDQFRLFIGRGQISRFIEDSIRNYLSNKNLDNAYKEMSLDIQRETAALEWCNALIGDNNHA